RTGAIGFLLGHGTRGKYGLQAGSFKALSRPGLSRGSSPRRAIPGKVLATVERDHLSGHRGAVEQKAHGAAHLLNRGGAAKRRCAAFALEIGLTLPPAREHGPGANRIHATAVLAPGRASGLLSTTQTWRLYRRRTPA